MNKIYAQQLKILQNPMKTYKKLKYYLMKS